MPPAPRPGTARQLLLVGQTDWIRDFAAALKTRTEAAIRVAETAGEAHRVVRREPIDCVVSAYDLGETTGVAFTRTVREDSATLPVVLCTAAGSEAIASDALSAGVTEYVALRESSPAEALADQSDDRFDDRFDDQFEDVLGRIDRSVRAARRTVTQRDRARQFDAIFHDARTATWVLDPVGALTRVNQAARDIVDADVDGLVGEPFWTLPWWDAPDGIAEDVRRIVETALDGGFGQAVVSRDAPSGETHVVELSARPVRDERGELVSIVVGGVDITDRVALERDLRRSEELHRVTLNNMTDTVLITDEDGEYTYVCPNVHFIFGYTAAEIRELGTITDLLGDDLFDRDELADESVLKNIECTATDKAGREHTLLVNVREVSIQDGTLLYSCRDITKRKQREEALTTLQETARAFLYAETAHEIAGQLVEDAPGVLDVEAAAVYRFDADANDLRPVAASNAFERLNGPPPTVHADASGLTAYSFLEDEALFFDDVHDADRLENPATALRSAAYIPLGDHGVFVAGAPEVGRFDEVTRELADLLAATAEAALDRVARESRLREQDRELQERNRELTALNRTNEIIREIDQALVRAETRSEVDHAVCDLLTADDRFAFAWIGVADPVDDTVDPRAWAGDAQGYLDSMAFPVDDVGVEPAGRTVATRDVTLVENVAAGLRDEPWRKEAVTRDFLSVLSVPLAYNEFTYGVLTVYANAQHAFDETSRAVLAELGGTIAAATSAIERKNALLTTSVTRIEFAVDDPTFVLSRLAAAADCTLTYQGGIQQTDEGNYVFVSVEGAAVEAVEDAAAGLVAIDETRRISADGSGGVLRFRIAQPFLALELADHGAVLRSATADPTGTSLVVDVPESVDVRHITRLVTDSFATADLRSKQTFDRSAAPDAAARFLDRLTERQLEVIQTAYYSGFFESPRETTGEELAETLDISPSAFYQHARTVQRKLFSTVFDDLGASTTAPTG